MVEPNVSAGPPQQDRRVSFSDQIAAQEAIQRSLLLAAFPNVATSTGRKKKVARKSTSSSVPFSPVGTTHSDDNGDDDDGTKSGGGGGDEEEAVAEDDDENVDDDDNDIEDDDDDDDHASKRNNKKKKNPRLAKKQKRLATAQTLAQDFLDGKYKDFDPETEYQSIDEWLMRRQGGEQERRRFQFMHDILGKAHFSTRCILPARFTAQSMLGETSYLHYLMPSDPTNDVLNWDGGGGYTPYDDVPKLSDMNRNFSNALRVKFNVHFSYSASEYSQLLVETKTTKCKKNSKKSKLTPVQMLNWNDFIGYQRFLMNNCHRIRYCCKGQHGLNEIERLAALLCQICEGKDTYEQVTKKALLLIHNHYFPEIHTANKRRRDKKAAEKAKAQQALSRLQPNAATLSDASTVGAFLEELDETDGIARKRSLRVRSKSPQQTVPPPSGTAASKSKPAKQTTRKPPRGRPRAKKGPVNKAQPKRCPAVGAVVPPGFENAASYEIRLNYVVPPEQTFGTPHLGRNFTFDRDPGNHLGPQRQPYQDEVIFQYSLPSDNFVTASVKKLSLQKFLLDQWSAQYKTLPHRSNLYESLYAMVGTGEEGGNATFFTWLLFLALFIAAPSVGPDDPAYYYSDDCERLALLAIRCLLIAGCADVESLATKGQKVIEKALWRSHVIPGDGQNISCLPLDKVDSVRQLAKHLYDTHDSAVPSTHSELEACPGVDFDLAHKTLKECHKLCTHISLGCHGMNMSVALGYVWPESDFFEPSYWNNLTPAAKETICGAPIHKDQFQHMKIDQVNRDHVRYSLFEWLPPAYYSEFDNIQSSFWHLIGGELPPGISNEEDRQGAIARIIADVFSESSTAVLVKMLANAHAYMDHVKAFVRDKMPPTAPNNVEDDDEGDTLVGGDGDGDTTGDSSPQQQPVTEQRSDEPVTRNPTFGPCGALGDMCRNQTQANNQYQCSSCTRYCHVTPPCGLQRRNGDVLCGQCYPTRGACLAMRDDCCNKALLVDENYRCSKCQLFCHIMPQCSDCDCNGHRICGHCINDKTNLLLLDTTEPRPTSDASSSVGDKMQTQTRSNRSAPSQSSEPSSVAKTAAKDTSSAAATQESTTASFLDEPHYDEVALDHISSALGKYREAVSQYNKKKSKAQEKKVKRARAMLVGAIKREATERSKITPCPQCSLPVGPGHKCDGCLQNMHGFCGEGHGPEGHGQVRRCKNCYPLLEERFLDEPSFDTMATPLISSRLGTYRAAVQNFRNNPSKPKARIVRYTHESLVSAITSVANNLAQDRPCPQCSQPVGPGLNCQNCHPQCDAMDALCTNQLQPIGEHRCDKCKLSCHPSAPCGNVGEDGVVYCGRCVPISPGPCLAMRDKCTLSDRSDRNGPRLW